MHLTPAAARSGCGARARPPSSSASFDGKDPGLGRQDVPLTPRRRTDVWSATTKQPRARHLLRASAPRARTAPTHDFDGTATCSTPTRAGSPAPRTASGAATCRTAAFDWGGVAEAAHRPRPHRRLRGARQGHHEAQPRRPGGAARHLRRPRASVDDRVPQGSRRHDGRAAARAPVRRASSGSAKMGLVNYWGYNTLNFFTPHAAYASRGRPVRRNRRGAARVQGDGAAAARGRPRGRCSTSSTTTPRRRAAAARPARSAASTTRTTTATTTDAASTSTPRDAATPSTTRRP